MSIKKRSRNKSKHVVWEYIESIVIVIALVMVIHSFIFQPYKVVSGSMEPTLQVGDALFVTKYTYGYGNYSISYIPLNLKKPLFFTSPRRGDIVLFRSTNNEDSKVYIKRLIGLPKEEIQMIKGVLHINGVPVKRENMGEYPANGKIGERRLYTAYKEELPNGVTYVTLDANVNYHLTHPDHTAKYIVPEGHYFFMGDNRNNSVDSRFLDTIGFIPSTHIVGKARTIMWNWKTISFKNLLKLQWKEERLIQGLYKTATQ